MASLPVLASSPSPCLSDQPHPPSPTLILNLFQDPLILERRPNRLFRSNFRLCRFLLLKPRQHLLHRLIPAHLRLGALLRLLGPRRHLLKPSPPLPILPIPLIQLLQPLLPLLRRLLLCQRLLQLLPLQAVILPEDTAPHHRDQSEALGEDSRPEHSIHLMVVPGFAGHDGLVEGVDGGGAAERDEGFFAEAAT